jgi:hypothetical protein
VPGKGYSEENTEIAYELDALNRSPLDGIALKYNF